jgi:hypothetical protein
MVGVPPPPVVPEVGDEVGVVDVPPLVVPPAVPPELVLPPGGEPPLVGVVVVPPVVDDPLDVPPEDVEPSTAPCVDVEDPVVGEAEPDVAEPVPSAAGVPGSGVVGTVGFQNGTTGFEGSGASAVRRRGWRAST